MIALDECVSPHVAMAQRNHVRLDWRVPYRTVERVRPTSWTCHCRATVYELCKGGGQGFIRRTVQLVGRHDVHETPRWPVGEVGVIWTALLSGRAR